VGEKRSAYRLLVGKPEETTGKTKTWRVDNNMNLVEIRWYGVDWTALARDRNKWRALANSVINFLVP
jgi:hypothetical protein